MSDIEVDTPTPIDPPDPPYPRKNEDELHNQLIEINEEFDSEDLEVLKFLCYDQLPASKLENADSALSIFENLKKGSTITYQNVDFLLECLWLMHRKDLIRKLGFVPNVIAPYVPHLNQVLPFRKLLLELSEDITDKEFETLRFYLDGKVKKKKLQDKKNMLELFIFLEREGLISHMDPDPLIVLLKTIKRVDLIDLVKEYFGKPRKPDLPRVPSADRANELQGNAVPPNVFSANVDRNRLAVIPPLPQPPPAGLPTGGQRQQRQPSPLDRTASAGTLSAPSSLENEQGIIPEDLLRRISGDVQEVSDDFGMELGFSNPDIATYRQHFPDPVERTYQMIKHWQRAKIDQGQVAPGLKYALDKLGYKRTSEVLMQWIYTFSMEARSFPQQQTVQPVVPPNDTQQTGLLQEEPNFQPAGPPEPPNVCMSLREAQPPVVEHLQQTGGNPTAFNPDIVMYPGNPELTNITQQLQQLSMAGGITVINNLAQIKEFSQGQMNNPAMEEDPIILAPPGQVQEQIVPVIDPQVPQPRPQIMAVDQDAASMELPVYQMAASPKGICVIINNRNFIVAQNDPSSKGMPERRGTEVDAANLHETFTKLDFIVEQRENLTDTDMMQFLVDVAHNVDHRNFDCFVCCILSHGVLNHLYGTNGRLVAIRDLTSVFQSNRCPSLAGKPKLFFLQACQGRDKMAGGEIEKDAQGEVEVDNDKEMIPNESDFLVGYATVPGYVSFRSRNHGSWYIRKLCEALEKFSERHDLLSILVKVNEEVSRGNAHVDGGIFKQTPAPVVTLRKKLFFFNQNRMIN